MEPLTLKVLFEQQSHTVTIAPHHTVIALKSKIADLLLTTVDTFKFCFENNKGTFFDDYTCPLQSCSID